MSIIYSLLIFVLVVFIHELGHFTVAKLVGVRVNEFSIGMGPSIINKTMGETQYSIRALPIGGYVAMEGEDDLSDDPRGYNNAPKYKKLMILVAGATMNFILAIVVASIAFMNLEGPSTTIDTVVDSSPAMVSGLQSGDKIVQIGDVLIDDWEDISSIISSSEKPINITIQRDGEILEIVTTPELNEGVYTIGIIPAFEPMNVDNPIYQGVRYTKTVSTEILRYLSQLISGKADTSALSGPIGIVRIIGESSKQGMVSVLFLTAMISANLGVVNLLPFPALDGGSIIITIAEMIVGRDLPEKVTIAINISGFVILMSFMLYVTIFNDIL